jgi:hypothetical protein
VPFSIDPSRLFCSSKAIFITGDGLKAVEASYCIVIQAQKRGLESCSTLNEWAVIRPMLPNKPLGAPRVNDLRVLKASSGCYDPVHLGATFPKLWSVHRL